MHLPLTVAENLIKPFSTRHIFCSTSSLQISLPNPEYLRHGDGLYGKLNSPTAEMSDFGNSTSDVRKAIY